MRILFTAQPMFGHINTVLPLASAAAAAEHDVAFATGASAVPLVEGRGFEVWPSGPPAAAAVDDDWIAFFVESARERIPVLLARAAEWRPDVVVREETELSGAIVATSVGAAQFVHGLGIMPPLRLWEPMANALNDYFDAWAIPGKAIDLREVGYFDVCPPALQPPGERIWRNVIPIRHAPGSADADDQLPVALDRLPYEQTVHVTLGTVYHDVATLSLAIDALRVLPVNLVVTTGPGTDREVFGPQPDHVLIEPYLPHAQLLPRCSVVVGHGGAGILFGALSHGLPQLVLPQGADQHMNAAALNDSGAGLMLEGDQVTAAAIAGAVSRLLKDPSFATAAARVRDEIAATPGPAEVADALWGDQASVYRDG